MKLYIIGNGFDIYHEIPCKYSDFKRFCEREANDMYRRLNAYYDDADDLWSYFERNLPNINGEALISWAADRNPDWNRNWEGYYCFIDELKNEVDFLEPLLSLYFRDWIMTLNLENITPRLNLDTEDCKFLNFNYTKTLEIVYHVNRNDITYIHGVVNGNFPKLVVGHCASIDEIRELFQNDNVFKKEAYDEIAGLVAGWRKDTERIISENENFFNSIHTVNEIYVLGSSMSDVDLPYFNKIKNVVEENAVWNISVNSDPGREHMINMVHRLGVDINNVNFISLDDLANHE